MKGKRPKKILDKATILKIEKAANTKSKTKKLGEVELKFVSLNDSVQITRLLEKIKDDREFAARVLHSRFGVGPQEHRDINR